MDTCQPSWSRAGTRLTFSSSDGGLARDLTRDMYEGLLPSRENAGHAAPGAAKRLVSAKARTCQTSSFGKFHESSKPPTDFKENSTDKAGGSKWRSITDGHHCCEQ